MQNPHGLGMNSLKKLYICEGTFGLKSYDASDVADIKPLEFFNFDSYDIIVFDDHIRKSV